MATRLTSFLRLYWRVAVSPLGAVLLALASLDAMQHKYAPYEDALLLCGVVLTVYGGISASNFTSSNKQLSDELSNLRSDLAKRKHRRVFLILAAWKEDFQIELNHQLLRIGREREFVVQVFCPSTDFSPDSMLRSQEFVVENADQFFGGLVVSSQFADDNLRELRSFAEAVKVPVVFIDHVPPQNAEATPSNVSWVTVCDATGGEKAVEAVVALGIEPRRILVVAGPAKRDRQAFFEKGVIERWPTCVVRTTTDGGFNRRTTEDIVLDILIEATAQKLIYNVIFCTTDSMTLGCLDAIQRIDWDGQEQPHVIGYDGIEATRHLIMRRGTQLKRVVVQDAARLAGVAFQELENVRSSRGNGVVWVEPTLFPG